MSGGRLGVDPLFQGLARPTMIAGVSFMYFVLNTMIVMVIFINAGAGSEKVFAFGMGVVIHIIGYLLCRREPRAVELWMLRLRTGFLSWNRVYHSNTNSYDVY